MGNQPSTERGSSRKNEVLVVKPPADWNAHTEAQKFVVVSPQSDISNPSQFRHHHNRKHSASAKTPMRKRTSKVISKSLPHPQHPRITTTLPEPEAFYFDPASLSTDPMESMESSNKQQHHQHRNLNQVVREKATRAKRLLKGCWKEQKETFEGCIHGAAEDEQVEHECFKSKSPNAVKSYRNAQKHYHGYPTEHAEHFGKAEGPQFIPDIEEVDDRDRTMSPREVYIHDEELYIKRMVEANQTGMPSETPLATFKDEHLRKYMNPTNASIDMQEGSPVIKLFERRGVSDCGLESTKKSLEDENTDRVKLRHSCPGTIETEEPKRAPNTVDRDIQKQVDDQVRLQFESKSEQIGRVKRLRESYLQKLEETKRLSIEENQRRNSIESQIQEEEKEPFDEDRMVSPPSPYDENKENAPYGRGRASDPVRHGINSMANAQPLRKSEPAPTNNNEPVLRKISGWEIATKNNQATLEVDEIPIHMQLAGWKQAANEKKPKSEHPKSSILNSKNTYKVDAYKEDRAINQAASRNSYTSRSSDGDARIPLPFKLQHSDVTEEPNETPVVKKMSKMLMATHSLLAEFGDNTNSKRENGMIIPVQDLSESMDSCATPFSEASAPMMTEDTLVNAAFLFSPSYVNHEPSLLRLGGADVKSETSTTISTLDSRNRLLPPPYHSRPSPKAVSDKPSSSSPSASSSSALSSSSPPEQSEEDTKTVPQNHSKPTVRSSVSSSRSTDSSDRRVRFSIGNQVVISSAKKPDRRSVEHPTKSPLKNDTLDMRRIEHKLSDLTDIFSTGRESLVTTETNPTMSSVTEDSGEEQYKTSHRNSPDVEYDTDNDKPSPPTHWSYSIDMDNGVTPLRSGKGGANTTNSPYKRFNEAKNRFAVKKNSPVKRSSPVKPRASKGRQSGGLVHARVAAMEQQTHQVPMPMPKSRRDTTGHQVIAPRRTTLKSAHFRPRVSTDEAAGDEASKKPSPPQAYNKVPKSSKQKSNNNNNSQVIKSLSNDESGYHADTPKSHGSSDSDMESEIDAFQAIRKTSTMDEEDQKFAREIVQDMMRAKQSASIASYASASTDYDGDDDFAAILQYQTSMDEDDSVGEETVTTIQRTRSSMGSAMSGETAPTVVRRMSVGENSVQSGTTAPTVARRSSTNQSGGAVPTLVRHEHSDIVQAISSVSRTAYPYGNRLPFREEALVRPTEQSHRAAPGSLILSPMQRTPLQAMKWRALAAAAQHEKSGAAALGTKKFGGPPRRKSLAERHPNVTDI